MIVTEAAVVLMELSMERWQRRIARLFGRGKQEIASGVDWDTAVLPGSLTLFDASGQVARADTADDIKETVSASVVTPEVGADTLSVNERKARAAAVRALMQARDGRFDQACELFAEAARLDPSLNLTNVPTFWELPRAGQQAAVDGYDLAGREEDAMLLAAELAYTFRPKLVRRHTVGAAPASGD
jgi:hypothetical protein